MSDCKNCKHLVMYDYKNKSYSCELGECEFEPEEQEPTTKNDLGVEHHKQNIKAYAHDFGVSEEQAESELRVTTKNDLGVDCISRAEAIKCLECDFDITGKENMKTVVNYINSAHDKIVNLPRVKQEPFKPMVEIDLDYVIKQKYIERDVLNKIRAEIEELSTTTCTETRRIYIDADDFKENVLAIFDKYKADRETLADIYKPTLKADLCIMDEFAFDPQEESEE